MIHLYNSEGQHIATLDSSQLYSASGRHIGEYVDDAGVFIDLQGRYLGQIVHNDRLLEEPTSHFHERTFSAPPKRDSIASSPGTVKPRIPMPARYADVDRRKI